MADPAVLGGGCFWCLDAVYREIRGVTEVVSGYAGGMPPDPSYELVCTGTTGHAEVVQVHFDPDVVSYGDLLDIFFTIHDPTQLNRQGADVGTQYRSVVFVHSDDQRAAAERAVGEAAALWDDPIATAIEPAPTFYPAEAYHQDYFRKNPENSYCQAVVAPKVGKARRAFAERLMR